MKNPISLMPFTNLHIVEQKLLLNNQIQKSRYRTYQKRERVIIQIKKLKTVNIEHIFTKNTGFEIKNY